MTILGGAFNGMVKGSGVGYLLDGYSVIPLIGKVCPMSWKVYQTARAHITDLKWWEDKGWLKNIGIVCGHISNNLVVIDLDGKEAVDLFKPAFGDLMARTFTVKTGSGLHVYLHTDTLPANRKISLGDGHSGIEIRGEGQYVVAVPSIHPTTQKPYEIYVRKPAARIDGLWDINSWLDTLETPKSRDLEPLPERDKDSRELVKDDSVVFLDRYGKAVKNPKAYARIALTDECRSRVARASEGNRMLTLFAGAQRMSQFINMGLLNRSEVVHDLLNAARCWTGSDTPNEREILATIASGFNSIAGKDTR